MEHTHAKNKKAEHKSQMFTSLLLFFLFKLNFS
jgi:hypothetical protein